MNNSFNPQVSFYSNIRNSQNTTYAIDRILNLIRTERYGKEIEEIRNETDRKKKDILKQRLPAVTVSGLFYGRRKKLDLVTHSGLMQIDIDKVGNLEEVAARLRKDDHSFSVFTSPSGNGIKVLVRITNDASQHELFFNEVERYYLVRYNIKIDTACKDVSRLMFLSSDRTIYVNENAHEFKLDTLSPLEKIVATALATVNKRREFVIGDRNNYVFHLACECRRLGLKFEDCLTYCTRYIQIDFSFQEINRTLQSAYTEIAGLNPTSVSETRETEEFLTIRTASQWLDEAKNKPISNMLFSEFWHEEELCILFADTNVGKSILAVQIADSITKGKPIPGFKLTAQRQPVALLDFELSMKQFQKRYSQEYALNYPFDENFLRVEPNPNCTDYEDFENTLFSELQRLIQEKQIRVLIVDNITYLKTQSTETARDALPLMKKLVELKKKYCLSLLILAHTPKRDQTKHLSINDLAGSKQLANLTDAIFGIGKSFKEEGLRYIIQHKTRATEIRHSENNVAVCRITKPFNFLGFEFVEYGEEREHLRQLYDSQKTELDQAILDFRISNPAASLGEIARSLNTNKMKVKRVLDKHPDLIT